MGFSTERYARKKSKTKKQEERAKRLTKQGTTNTPRKRKRNGVDSLNKLN